MSGARAGDGYCRHPIEARVTQVDSMDVLYDECRECEEVWVLGKISESNAEAVRRATSEYLEANPYEREQVAGQRGIPAPGVESGEYFRPFVAKLLALGRGTEAVDATTDAAVELAIGRASRGTRPGPQARPVGPQRARRVIGGSAPAAPSGGQPIVAQKPAERPKRKI